MLKEQLRNILILITLLGVGLIISMLFKTPDDPVSIVSDPAPTYNSENKVRIIKNIKSVEPELSRTKNKDQDACLEKYLSQMKYLDNETLSEEFTFDKYKTNYPEPKVLSNLDLNFSETARRFRTSIGDQLSKKGVNFDGKYTIVGSGLTGWPGFDWIVDRETGEAYEFPYIDLLRFEKDSNLIILNMKSDIKIASYYEGQYDCSFWGLGGYDVMAYELIPHYFLWEGNKLIHLGPKEFNPIINWFWSNYFNNPGDPTRTY